MKEYLERSQAKEFLTSYAQLTVYGGTIKWCVPIEVIDKIPSADPKKKTCEYCGSEEYYARGFCKSCYYRFRKYGSPEPRKHPGRTRQEEPSKKVLTVLCAYNETLSISEAARKCGISRQYVHQLVKRWPDYIKAERGS